MAIFSNVEPLKMWVHKILPLVYDDSMSYYETLCKVVQKLSEVVSLSNEQTEYLNNWLTSTEESLERWKDNTKTSLEEKINTDLGAAIDRLETEFADELLDAEGMIYGTQNDVPVEEGSEYYQNNAEFFKERASTSAIESRAYANGENASPLFANNNSKYFRERSEAWAVGEVNGVDVPDTDETHENNAKYYAGEAERAALTFVPDPTLSEAGRPAEAKATGDIIVAEYDETATYAVGDYVRYEGTLYQCNTAIETAEEWTSAHWTASNVMNEVTDLKLYEDEKISEANAAISTLAGGVTKLAITAKKGFNTTAAITITDNAPVPETNNSVSCAWSTCQSGDKFTYTGTGSSSYADYCWLKSDGTKILPTGGSTTRENYVITAPDEAAYVVFNSLTRFSHEFLKGYYAEKQDKLTFDTNPTANSDNPVTSGGIFNAIGNRNELLTTDKTSAVAAINEVFGNEQYTASMLANITGKKPIELVKGGYWTTPDTGGAPTYVENANWATARVSVSPGDQIYIFASAGAGNQRLYARIDADGYVISRSGATLSGETKVEIGTTSTAREIVINNNCNTQTSGYYAYIGSNSLTIPNITDWSIVARNSSVIDNDIDNAVRGGMYSWTTSYQPANTPSFAQGKAFELIVYGVSVGVASGLRTTQMIVVEPSDTTTSKIYYRYKTTSGWSNWVELSTTNDPYHYWCYGKTINWLGDSIVAGGDFDELVCDALGMTDNDYGISGSTISLKGDGTDTRNACVARYSSMTDTTDIIAVSAGTNDWMYAWAPFGDLDSTENTTFCGALKNLCEGLITKYPRKVIFFTTPIKRAQAFTNGDGGEYTADGVPTTPFSKNKYGKTLMDYCDAIKEICGYYSIPVLDLNRESLMNPHIAAQADLFSDGTHPNSDGRRIQARRVAGWLTQLAYTIST